MNILEKISAYVAKYFGSNANFYVKQISDGSYRKTSGVVNAALVRSFITNRQSIACYQRNVDHTINWICFDFDILKSNIGSESHDACEMHLLQTVRRFVEFLKGNHIAHILEFSGNRGLHIWINFTTPIFPYVGFEIVKYLLDKSGISIDHKLIGLDLFPSSSSHKSSHGKAVKVPLSRHAKSGLYSVLLKEVPVSFASVSRSELDDEFLHQQLTILEEYCTESISSLEIKTDCKFDTNDINDIGVERIQKIKIISESLNIDELINHWSKIPLVRELALDIQNRTLSHVKRQLLVGLLSKLVNCKEENIGQASLMSIFSRMPNFDVEKTRSALSELKNLPFPSLEIVESACHCKHEARIDNTTLAMLLIPNISSLDDGLFTITEPDVKVTKIAERNYLYQNDEVRSIKVIEELGYFDFQLLKNIFEKYIIQSEPIELYRHKRKELKKDDFRELITLSASARLFTSWAIKHLVHVYNYSPSQNSYGYKLNQNFTGGHIFKPWLYQWIEFLSGIADVINNELHTEHYIVKADIKSFYDSIPQDNLERLLLTGHNNALSVKLDAMHSTSSERYKAVVRSLMGITRECNIGREGVPQGPAYARVFAEIYLGQIDEVMDGLLASGDLLFYHRYVDDIFFVANSQSSAEEKLAELDGNLKLLGLTLNLEKTSIAKIGNFVDEFDKYRAQAKYAIDAISSNVENATEYEKNIALLEYNKLISKQTDNDDAAFLFSHMPGFSIADRYRDAAVNAIVKSGVGRGNLFKHVFIHLINSPELWPEFRVIDKFTELQSEVFTSVCLEILFDQREANSDLISFIGAQLEKLTNTVLVVEHKVYLQLYFNIGVGAKTFKPLDILRCTQVAENPNRLKIDEEIVDLAASHLNGITDLGDFVAQLYPLCIESNIDKGGLVALAKIFSAKLSSDERNGRLLIGKSGDRILTRRSANEFYQLLCLFTLSTAISNSHLLERAWEFCATIFNTFERIPGHDRMPLWYKNFDHIEINKAHLNLAVVSITERAIWRGAPDKYEIYANYHNALMILVLTGERNQTKDDVRIAIGQVKDIGTFYQWLFSDNVDLFPTRKWFIENLTKNDCIILKREDQILIRKRVESFVAREATEDRSNKTLIGYADHLTPYAHSEHTSVFELINPGRSFFENLRAIKSVVVKYSDEALLPNLFSQKAMLTKEGLLPFSDEIRGGGYLIYQSGENIEASANIYRNFLKYLFAFPDADQVYAYSSAHFPMNLSNFYSRHILILDPQQEVPDFLRTLDVLFEAIHLNCDEVSFDLMVASSLYALQRKSEAVTPFFRIKSFFEKYNKIHRSASSKHIYKVEQDSSLSKESLSKFFETILAPIESASNYRPDFPFRLASDIQEFSANVCEMIIEISKELSLSNFIHCTVTQSIVTEKISVNGVAYSYDNVFIVNPAIGINQSFSSEHVFLLQSSEDIFHFVNGENIYLFFTPKEFTIGYSDIVDRHRTYFTSKASGFVHYPYVEHDPNVEDLDINGAAAVISTHRDISKDEAHHRIRAWLKHIPETLRQPMIWLIEAHETMSPTEIQNFRNHFDATRAKLRHPVLFKRFRDFGGVHRILADNPELARALDDFGPNSIPSSATEISIFSDLGVSGSQFVSAFEYYLSVDEMPLNKMYFCDSDADRRRVGGIIRKLSTINLCFVLYTDECISKIKNCLSKHGLSPKLEVTCGRDISATALLGSSQKLSVKNKAAIVSILQNGDVMEHLMGSVFSTNGDTRKYQRAKLSTHETVNIVTRYRSMPKKALDFLFADLRGIPGSALFERVRELTESKLTVKAK